MTATETTRASAVPADEALLNRSDVLLQDFDRAFRMFHEFVTGCRALMTSGGRDGVGLGTLEARARPSVRVKGWTTRSQTAQDQTTQGPNDPEPQETQDPKSAGPRLRRAQTAQDPKVPGGRQDGAESSPIQVCRSCRLGLAWFGPCVVRALRFLGPAFFGFCVFWVLRFLGSASFRPSPIESWRGAVPRGTRPPCQARWLPPTSTSRTGA